MFLKLPLKKKAMINYSPQHLHINKKKDLKSSCQFLFSTVSMTF